MQQSKDPVCGAVVDAETTADRATFRGTTYYFCSAQCLRQFEANPARYAGETAAGMSDETDVAGDSPDAASVELERHEPRFTKWGGLVAPKFGAAGSGGAEYERLPEAHGDVDDDGKP